MLFLGPLHSEQVRKGGHVAGPVRKKTRMFRQLKGATCQLLLLVLMVHVENTENDSVGDEAGAATLEYIHV